MISPAYSHAGMRLSPESLPFPSSLFLPTLPEDSADLWIQNNHLPDGVTRLQAVGENVFVAMLVVAVLQAAVAVLQYRTNPTGQLIAPPGLTRGMAQPHDLNDRIQSIMMMESTTYPVSTIINNTTHSAKETMTTSSINEDSTLVLDGSTTTTTISTSPSRYAEIMNRINRWMGLLIPWAGRRLAYVLERNTHLFHFGFILILARLFDIPNRWFPGTTENQEESSTTKSMNATTTATSFDRLVVLGDSLAVGMGTVDVFDASKDNSVPYQRLENLEDDHGTSPAFPQALAETLAAHVGHAVAWRSAGVDGGDVQLIEEYCLGVVEEECQAGRPPDVVVILCGFNDLKYFVANPFANAGPRAFRTRLDRLIRQIKDLAPASKVIVPMVPTQMFHRNSPLNIFPLNFFLDTIVGFWDAQKKLVADHFPSSSNVEYVRLRPGEVSDWYHVDRVTTSSGRQDNQPPPPRRPPSLIAADGIHPSARCYTMWAQSVGLKILHEPPLPKKQRGATR